ncbi:LPS export ABC transporter permease LptF [Candidatus Profftia tarda]|uniref:LPS export ABC transporter permease LptF n=1 Tax=Candidatus Profftia tarda TaxID=1177216 RepID=UPI001C1FA296|nr:LPS export ABC transporter permease LptF [Candidatus Profftia tarda]
MIIIRYLVRETLKSQIAILCILLLIFFCQKMVRILGAAVEGEMPTNLVLSLLGLGLPELAQLILPLSLFLALLMTLTKLYNESEIVVMHACGLGKESLIKTAMLLACVTGFFALINAFWVCPWSSFYSAKVIAEAKANPGLASMVAGQFQTSKDGHYVLFIGDVQGKNFKDVFLAQIHPKNMQYPSIIVADTGHLEVLPDGAHKVFLDTSACYESTVLLRGFRITSFVDYEAIIGHQSVPLKPSNVEQASMKTLWNSKENDFRAEFHWRITLVFSVFVMALMVIGLIELNPRQGRVLNMLPVMLLYLIFFLIQRTQRSEAAAGKIDPLISLWIVNGFYLVLAIALNIWDTLPMRRIRARITRQGEY